MMGLAVIASASSITFGQFFETKADLSMAQVSPLKPQPFHGKLGYAPDVVLVAFHPKTTTKERLSVLDRLGLQEDPNFKSPYISRLLISKTSLLGRSFEPVESAIQLLRYERAIRFAEPDMQIKPDQSVPNDPRFNEMWGLHNTGQTGGTPDADVDAPEAWNAMGTRPKTIVGLIDDGVDWNHPDILANIWVNTGEIPGNGIDDDGNGFIDDRNGWDFVSNDNNPTPTSGNDHGTHTAGTIAAVINNGIGISGVAKDVELMPIRMYNGQSSWMSDLVRSIDYCWQNGAKVISVSYNIDGYTQALVDSILRAKAADCIYVNSAGNNGQMNPPRAAIRSVADNVVFVAASDHNDTLAGFSNYGVQVEIAAPGVDILSLMPGSGYQMMSGTSMATPHVAGALASVRSVYPNLTARQALDRLISTAETVPAISGNISGGRLNLSAALDDDSIAPSDPTNFLFLKKSTSAVKVSFHGSGDDGVVGQASNYEIRVSKNPINSGNYNSAQVIPISAPQVNAGELITTELKGLQSGTNYYVAIKAKDNVGNVSGMLLGQVSTVQNTVLDDADTNVWFSALSGPWARTTEQYQSGSMAWSDSPGGSYVNNANVVLQTAIRVPVKALMSLNFALKYDLESGYDYLNVELSRNGTTWDRVARFTGTSGWSTHSISLGAYLKEFVYIRFQLTSDGSVTRDGVYVDDVSITENMRLMFDNMETAGTFTSNDGFARTTSLSFSPSFSWTDSPSGAYSNNYTTTMIGQSLIDLSQVANPTLAFRGHINTEAGYDYLRALVSTDGGANFTEVGRWSGAIGAWNSYSAPLPSGLVKLGFRFTSDVSVTADGVYVDDVSVTGEPWLNP